ncbi:MAG TPA: hypothetical protein VEY70_25755 [Metabacillus sp.]|nr:hypothetical protein [Metabacillus sp.]
MEDKVLHLEAQATAHDYLYGKTQPTEKAYSVDVEEEFLKAKEAYRNKSASALVSPDKHKMI